MSSLTSPVQEWQAVTSLLPLPNTQTSTTSQEYIYVHNDINPGMEELTDLPSYLKGNTPATPHLKPGSSCLPASNADGLAILEATAPWCSQCKTIAPFVAKLQKKYPEARFYNYNTDTALAISQELSAHQMPTFHIFKDGDLMESVTGAKPKELEIAIAKSYDGTPVEDGE